VRQFASMAWEHLYW
jgi:hypothetical protein